MRKLISIFIGIMLLFVGAALCEPQSYTVELDTYAVSGSTAAWSDWPNISGNGKITKIIIANDDDDIQTVDFYDETTTTTTTTSILPVVSDEAETLTIDFDDDRDCYLSFTNGLVIKKSTTASTVDCTIIYR